LRDRQTGGLGGGVGNTPVIPLRRVTTGLLPQVQVMAQVEWFNPSGSAKDRPAVNILQVGLASQHLTQGKRLHDSTSGNMGIAYATFGATMAILITLSIPANASAERIGVLRALGAEVIVTNPSGGSDGPMTEARSLARKEPATYWYAAQHSNAGSWQAHYLTTGPEQTRRAGGFRRPWWGLAHPEHSWASAGICESRSVGAKSSQCSRTVHFMDWKGPST
jgi:cysteine synthase B